MHYFTITISIKYQANKKKLPDVITFAWILVFYNLINFINYQFILFKVGTNQSFHSFHIQALYIKRPVGSCFEDELYVSIKFCTSDSMFDN